MKEDIKKDNEMRREKDFISCEHKFIDEECNPPYSIKIALNKQKLKDEDLSVWFTVWGKWDGKNQQLDLDFDNPKEAVKFLQGMIAVVKEKL